MRATAAWWRTSVIGEHRSAAVAAMGRSYRGSVRRPAAARLVDALVTPVGARHARDRGVVAYLGNR